MVSPPDRRDDHPEPEPQGDPSFQNLKGILQHSSMFFPVAMTPRRPGTVAR